MFLPCHTHAIEPINSEQYWEKTGVTPISPPIVKIAPGRPKKKKTQEMILNNMLLEATS